LKKSKRKDYYKLLVISKSATPEEVKKSYKKSALKWHPDKQGMKTEEEKVAADKMFKDIGEAYSILSDPQKRQRYDDGADIEEIEQGGGGGGGHGFHGDPNDIFKMFFAGGGGGMGGGQSRGGGGGQSYSFSY
jgi:DnaJ family protein C protein 7